MNRTMIMAAAIGGLLSAPLMSTHASAADMPMKASAQDGLFVMDADQGNLTEIKTSEMVEDKSKDSDLNAIAKTFIKDHRIDGDKLSSAASDADVYRMGSLDKSHEMEIGMLESASDADFAKTYLMIQDKEHRDAISAFQAEADMGMNPGLKQIAMQTLPQLKEHLKMVQDAEKKMGIPTGTMVSLADLQTKPKM